MRLKDLLSAEPKEGRRGGLIQVDDNLFLQLRAGPNGVNRSWVFQFQLNKVRTTIGLGSATGRRAVSLGDVRLKAAEFQKLLMNGTAPPTKRGEHKAKLAAKASEASRRTFRQCVDEYLKDHKTKWGARQTGAWAMTLGKACEVLGDMDVSDITTAHVRLVLDPIWYSKHITATRLRTRIFKVLGAATVNGYRSGPNPAAWEGHLAEVYPVREEVQKVKHLEDLPYAELPAVMLKLRELDSVEARALEFNLITALRPSRVRDARWEEIKESVWTIPEDLMKAEREHRCPLSDRARAILESLPRDCDLVFSKNGHRIPEKAMLQLLRSLSRPGPTVHATARSGLKTWASDKTEVAREVIESCLSHAIGDKSEQAYQKGTFFEKRRGLMEAWSAYLEGKPWEQFLKPKKESAEVINIDAKRKAS
jgi:integrase